MLITKPAQAPHTQATLDEDFELGLGSMGSAATVNMSHKQLQLLARAVGALRGTVDPQSFTPAESMHLLWLADALAEIPQTDKPGMVHGLCL